MSSPAASFTRFTNMDLRPHTQNPLPVTPPNGILQWLLDRIPERGTVVVAARLVLHVAEGGRISGLEISSPDPLVTRRMHKLLGGAMLPEGLSLPAGRYEVGPMHRA